MRIGIIGGAGTIGTTVAYSLAVAEKSLNVRLVDVNQDAAEGHAIGIGHGRILSQIDLPIPDRGESGSVKAAAAASDADPLDEVDCVVVTASVPPPEGTDKPGTRTKWLEKNRALADDIAALLSDIQPVPVIVASNPVDQMTYLIAKGVGWSRYRFIGYSLSETARASDEIARILDVDPASVYCPVLGEHGDHTVPLFSRLTVEGERVSLDAPERHQVREYIREIPYEIVNLRGRADSSRWVTGQGLTRLVVSMLEGGPTAPLGLSVELQGEYGFEEVCLSVPVTLDQMGVSDILEWELATEEREGLEAAYRSIAEH